MVETSETLAVISANPWTGIILSHDGQIEEVVPLPPDPTADAFLDFARTRAKGRRFRLVRQASLSEAELNAMIADLLRPTEPGRSWKSEPSVFTQKRFWTPLAGVRAIADGIAEFIARRVR